MPPFIIITTEHMEHASEPCQRINPTEREVLHSLRQFSNIKGGSCHPGTKKLKKLNALAERTIHRAVKGLEGELDDKGQPTRAVWIYVDRVEKGRNNNYRLNVDEKGRLTCAFYVPLSVKDSLNIGTSDTFDDSDRNSSCTDVGTVTPLPARPSPSNKHNQEHNQEPEPTSPKPPRGKRQRREITLRRIFDEEDVEYKLALLLMKLIRRNNGNALVPAATPQGLADWAGIIDEMIRQDNRDPRDMVDVIEWSQDNDFWCTIILSAETLRKKYDQLRVKMLKEKEARERGGPQTYDSPSLRDHGR